MRLKRQNFNFSGVMMQMQESASQSLSQNVVKMRPWSWTNLVILFASAKATRGFSGCSHLLDTKRMKEPWRSVFQPMKLRISMFAMDFFLMSQKKVNWLVLQNLKLLVLAFPQLAYLATQALSWGLAGAIP